MKRTIWYKMFGLLLVAVLVLGVCGLAASDKLVYLFYGEPGQADPATAYDARSSVIIQNVYDRLITFEGADASKFAPQLATDWEASEDGMVLTFHLREDATFHNGDPVTAAAVKYSFDRVITMNQPPAWMLTQMMNLDSTRVIDDYTVEVHLTMPYGAALGVLTHPVASIVNPAVVEANGGIVAGDENLWMNQNEGGAGSGPYILEQWIPAERLTFERYDGYWGEKGTIKTIECPIVTEMATRIMLLLAGDADIHPYFPAVNVPDVEGADNLIIDSYPTFDVNFIALGCRGPVGDKVVRQAISYAFPYQDVVDYVYLGYASTLTGAVPAGMLGYYEIPADQRYKLDIDKANQLLDEAGWVWPGDPGVGFRHKDYELLDMVVLLPIAAEVRLQTALLWQAELKKIGFDLIIREIVWAIAYKVVRAHEVEGMLTGWLPDYPDPDNYVDAILNSGNADAIYGNEYNNPDMDALIAEAKLEVDPARRVALYKQIQELAFEDAPYIWTAQAENVVIMNERVKGYYYNPALQIDFKSIYFE
ncbi:ABC transporter substrate-binding protein [Candidatus Bipolaricaulota bacterium]|nr:ABC transporter substrate-binding protein [Candidatus Bipolaricaulota bacterium]